jgi:hypothetical protein
MAFHNFKNARALKYVVRIQGQKNACVKCFHTGQIATLQSILMSEPF